MEQSQNRETAVFSLSLSQQNIWALEQTCPGTPINHISTTLRIHGRVDLALLQESISMVIAADPSLRARIVLENGIPMQYHASYQPEQFPYYDFTQTSADGISRWEESVTRETFSLLGGPLYRFYLFRCGEQEGGILIKLHHIISDGWSQILLCNRIGQTYLDLLAGKTPELGTFPNYRAHVEEEAAYLASPARRRDERYWTDTLQSAGEPSVLKSIKGAVISPVGCRKSFDLPQSLNNAIYTFCTKNRVSPFSVIYLALAIYLRRVGGAQGFIIGVPVFNRISFAFKQTSGMFVSTLPFCNELQEDWSFSQCSDHLTERWMEMLRHQRLPFSRIQELSRDSGSDSGRLFHIALSYQNGVMLSSPDAAISFSGRWHYSGYQMEQLCIHMSNLVDERHYSIDYDYLTQVFSAHEIDELHHCLMNILDGGLRFPQQPIHQLSMLGSHERERVLYLFNRTDAPLYDKDLYARFAHIAARHPGKAALICGGRRTSYQELERTAVRIQAGLRSCGDRSGLVAVLLPRIPALHGAMLGILRAGQAFLLLTPGQPTNRLLNILQQSGATALITDASFLNTEGLSDCGIPLLDVNALPDVDSFPAAEVPPDAPAYVVYTSGSTGTPKGVEISRYALLNLAVAMAPIYGPGAVLSLCSVGFDAFLLESAVALLNGRTVLLPADADLETPERLAQHVRDYGIGFLATTPSRLAALLRYDSFARALRRMECIICGGEAFPSDLLYHLRLLTNARIYNQYGPSEATVAVSMKLLNDAPAITAGAPMPNCRLYVLDSFLNPLPVGVYGDLYIGGLCVGLGYRNQPELTAASFLDSPFEPGERLYRTGDTACWTSDGEIVLGGRTDSQVKLRGLRVELQEVSACLRRYPGIKQCAVIVSPCAGQDVLAAYYTSDNFVSEAELLSFAASYLPHYMIPTTAVRLEALPLTRNGKLDTACLPELSSAASCGVPANALERSLLEIFTQVLNKRNLGSESDYFLCGGNSLNAMETVGCIQERTGRSIRIADLYACRTVRRLAALLSGAEHAAPMELSPAPHVERYPLTPIQQGLYVQSLMDPTGRAYQMPGAFRLSAAPEPERLQDAFRRMIAGEPLLRTAFVQEENGIFMRVLPQVNFQLAILTGSTLELACESLLKPFRLDQPPLLRAGLWEQDGVSTLVINLHHIIGDGLTTPVLLRRLDCCYRGEALCPLRVSYLDYAWQYSQLPRRSEQLTYWAQNLSPLPEPLELPGDFPRTYDFNYRGGHVCAELSRELSDACDNACAKWGVSPYMFFLAAFSLLLSRLSGKQELVVGVPAAGRLLPESREMCGPFINTLPLRLNAAGDCSVEDFLHAVREAVNGMLDHQQVGLEEIATTLKLPRVLSQSPLYQVMFTQRPLDADSFALQGHPMTYLPLSTGTAKMDLVTELYRERDCYCIQMEYASQLFLPETVRYFGRCFTALCASLAHAASELPLSRLESLAPSDRMELLDIPQNTAVPFLNLPVPALFQRQMELAPEAPAVIFHGGVTSRRELDRRANQIANLLVKAGACPGARVGIALSRNVDLVAAVLGIWKVGAAYSPLLASYPRQRLDYMISIAGMTHVLCDRVTAAQLPDDLSVTLVCTWEDAPDHFSAVPLKESDLAEVLFTSGSTGQPKGVMLAWRSIANMVAGFRDILKQSGGPILCTTNVVFDMFNGEVVIPLSMGKVIVMTDEEEMMLPWKLAEIIRRDGVTITQSTPSRVQMWLSNEAFCAAAPALEMMIYGGEVVTEALLHKAQDASHDAIQINMYGPTEGTVYSTTCRCSWQEHISIGWPMQNNRVYLLDENLSPVLPAAAGEIYLGGEGVSLGYISRPDLTEKAYLPDPFFPGQRMYRTGDIARQRLDGSYDFLGRRDAQVKLNGQRIELDEINGAFVSQGCGLQSATVPVRREDGSMELFTYYIPGEPALTVEDIRRRLETILPTYMIPSHFQSLDTMPRTPTGKIDLRQLKDLAAGSGVVPAQTEQLCSASAVAQPDDSVIRAEPGSREWLLDMWKKALNRTDITEDRSFFEQGGTSLTALSMLSRYNNHGIMMSLSQFYSNPTIQAQMRLLHPDQIAVPNSDSEGACTSLPLTVCTPVADLPSLKHERYPRLVPELSCVTPERRSMAVVFLTGATGFLGAHVLQALVESGAGTVICLTRDGSPQRLEAMLEWYFGGGCAAALMDRVEVLRGDIGQRSLGLSPMEYQALSGRLCAIWHCAADVRHYAADADALLRVNLDGTKEVIRLARAAQAPLYHMSTASISGDRLRGKNDSAVFTERDFDIGQIWEENLYVRSKFLAEAAVLDAVRDGLTARIFRLGRLVGRASDGTFQKNAGTNAFWLTLRGIHALGAIPASMAKMPMDLTPIDWCAQAAVALRSAPLAVYHLQHPEPPAAEDVARVIVPKLELLSDEAFAQRLSQVDAQGDLFAPLLDFWNRISTAPPTVAVTNQITMEELRRIGFDFFIPGPARLLRGFRFPASDLVEGGHRT